MRRSFLPLLVAASLGVAACSSKPGFVKEYKIDIQQGNVLTQEMVAQLKPGQTRDQVRFVLGTPLITDVFHQQRWDYVYRYQSGKTGVVESRRFSVFFDADGRLERVAGEVEPGTVDQLATPVAKNRLVDLGSVSSDTPLPPPDEPGYFSRFMNLFGF